MSPAARHRPEQARTARRAAALQHRRAEARARAERGRRARQRRRLKIGAVALVGVIVVVLAGVALWPDDDPPDLALHGELVSETGSLLPISAPPATYKVVYRSEGIVDGDTTVFTEEVTVRRPFDGRVVVRTGAPPGAGVQYDITSVIGRSVDRSDPSAPAVTAGLPMLSIGDVRLDAALEDLVDDGLFVVRERRSVDGRECQVYRTGTPPQSLTLTKPTDTDYVDVCVDDAGLMLEELTVVDGDPLQRAVATSVDVAPALTDADFTVEGEPKSLAEGGSVLTPLDLGVAPEPGQWTFAAAPAGYTQQGRYLLTAPDPATSTSTATTVAGSVPATVETTVDVWVSGPNAIIVEQGPVAAEGNADTSSGHSADLAGLGQGTIVPGAGGNVAVAHPDDGRFVRITATMPEADLVTLVGGLTRR